MRVARLATLAATFGWAAYVLASWLLLWNPADAGAYYDAAARLTAGEPLYLDIHPEAHEVYRYAPWFAYAWIPLAGLPQVDCTMGMCAVIEEQGGRISYWALSHPDGKPDFHDPACFAAVLPAPGGK